MTKTKTLAQLIDQHQNYCHIHGLPWWSADELMVECMVRRDAAEDPRDRQNYQEHADHLALFIKEWDDAAEKEDQDE